MAVARIACRGQQIVVRADRRDETLVALRDAWTSASEPWTDEAWSTKQADIIDAARAHGHGGHRRGEGATQEPQRVNIMKTAWVAQHDIQSAVSSASAAAARVSAAAFNGNT